MRSVLLAAAAAASALSAAPVAPASAAPVAPASAAPVAPVGVCVRVGDCVTVTVGLSGPTVCVAVTQSSLPLVIAPICRP
ncbi:MAG TPA: hypothetical protein VGX28_02600 [Frankiaceae bacterium]|jgi:hypothetical protein|nr:hypothetical protein [Frankiaceae bacterium]